MQSSRVLRFYLEELHELGAELSLAAHLADVSDELRALAERSPDTLAASSGEPYRLAVSGIYARLAATAASWTCETSRAPVGEAAAYADAAEFKADLDILDRSLIANNSRRDRARPAAAASPGGGLFRLPSRQPRHAAEFRRARAHHRRVDGRRDAGHVLSGAGRGGADRASRPRTAQRAAAGLALRQVQRRDRRRTRGVPCGRRSACEVRRRRHPTMHHLHVQGRCRTCWRSPCC